MMIDNEFHDDYDEWLQCLNSLWCGKKVDVIKRIIKMFTSPKEIVLDPFMGDGTTVEVANTLDRKAIGFEINEKYISAVIERLEGHRDSYEIIEDSCINITKYLYEESVDLCIATPPWLNMYHRNHAGHKKQNDFTLLHKNIGKTSSYSCYLSNLAKAFSEVYEVLKPNKMCIVIVMDMRKRDRLYPLHIDLANIMADIGFIIDDLIIWDSRKEHSTLKAVSNSCVYRTNIVHEYICIFKKE